ncbi:phage integrase [Bifidobacterium longum subsp. longum]|nr:tyrosine-type recombinase/integrase [Bifidobacterium longum]TCE54103.1 phage integrase [Bifidobacterium longum subsp. longum]
MGETTVGHVAGEVVRALYGAGYMESTIGQYRKSIRALERYAGGPDAVYTRGLGAGFAASTFSERTGGFSRQRWFDYGRLARLCDSYLRSGSVDLGKWRRSRLAEPVVPGLAVVMERWEAYLAGSGLASATVGHYRRMAGLFLTWLESHGVVSLDGSDGSHVLGFLAGLRSRWSESSMRHAASDLRPLFRWLGRDDLADAIGLAGIRRTHAIAGTLPDDEHRRLLEACASRSVPSRDAAITLLSLTCGLRACDVIGLRIADVDWDSMSIGLVQRKTGNPLTVPMTGPLAARLASWLLDERPATDDDRVFVRYKAPHVALRGHSSVYEAISRVMRHAGLGRRGGSRLLRRNAATRMLEAATPLPTISAVLGHAPRGNARVRAARAGRRIVMRPTEHGFVGPLAGESEEYIRFKASMGRHGATRVRVLRSFDRHCLEHGAVRLERGVVERWIAHRIDANPGGCRSWFSYIRDFGRWMRLAHDPDAYVLSDQWKAGSPRPTPYLLTDREAALFLRAAGTLESPSPWAWQSRAFFMLMACCGLRTREVRRLAVGHVDHKARSIDVVDSKAGRSRRLPVGDEVAAELLECDQRSRERFGDDRPAFFVTSTGNPVSPGMPGVVFRRVWTRAGLEWPQAGKRPRPYDFRHRFAFANIERWTRDGVDVMAMLPYLAAYMGHAGIDSTLYYVHASPDFHGRIRGPRRRRRTRGPGNGGTMSKARKTAASSGEPDFWRVARDWLHHWLPKVRGSSPKTVEAYRIGLESYVRWLETTEGTQRSHIGFGHFDRARLGRWVEWMRTERGYSDRTIMLRMTTMRVFLDHAGLEHPALTALGNDAAGIRVKPPARKPVDHLGEEHTKALLTAWGTGDAKSRRNRMLLILMYDTAARIGELAALTIADVGMDKPARVTLTGKRGKSRVVPLGERTRTHLAAYLEEFHPGPSMRDGDRPLFHSTRNGAIQPLSVDRIDEILKTAAARARRGTCPSMPERVHCHLIRRTRAMDLYQQGVPLPLIMQLLGHESMSTTSAFYAFATLDMMRKAVDAANPGPDPSKETWLSEQRLRQLHTLK